jgi:nucleoside-diphosphate-sugar epimerase
MPVYPQGANAYVDVRDVAQGLIRLAKEPSCSGKRFIAIGANLTYKELFTSLAFRLRVKPPHIKAGPVLSNLAWLGTGLVAALTGTEPFITRDLVRTSLNTFGYDSARLREAIGYTFIPIQKTIEDAAQGYREWEIKIKN